MQLPYPPPAAPSKAAMRRTLIWVAFALSSIVALAYAARNTDLRYKWQSRDPIGELRELPIGEMNVRGVVTYVDRANKRFWLQDETGAILVNQNPALAGVRRGDLVSVELRKTHSYDPAIGISSLGLTDFNVHPTGRIAPLPVPVKAAVPSLSAVAKTGIRVTVEGVVQSVSAADNGLVQLALGDQGQEAEALIPGDPRQLSQWLNARVRITGVLEVLLDEGGSPQSEYIWAQDTADLEKISAALPSTMVSGIRGLYADRTHILTNMVHLRGTVLYQENPTRLIVEDEWGTLGCDLDNPGIFRQGTPIEAQGFLKQHGLAIDLVHTRITPVAANEKWPEPRQVPITTIASLRALGEDLLRTAPPVKVSGVITYLNPVFRQFFLQDSTAGIFVKYSGTSVALYSGEGITVTGLANGGDFAPVIIAPKFIDMGPAPLPKPVPMTSAAKTGRMDSLYAEVEGIVHPIRERLSGRQQTNFDLYTSLGPVHVGVMPHSPQDDFMADLQDATVRVRGVVGEVFNSRKQLVGLQLAVANRKAIEIIEPGNPNPFDQPALPIKKLLSFSPHVRFEHRVVVSGTVTMLGDGFFYIQDKTGGVRVEGDASRLHLYEGVEAAGYASAAGYSPVLTDAVVRTRPGRLSIDSKPVTADMMSDGGFDSQLVSVNATLLSIEKSGGARTLSVLSGGHTFQAVLYTSDMGQPLALPQEGSVLRLTGICSVDIERGKTDRLLNKDPVTFKLLVRSPSDIQVLRGGSWWTLRHSLMVVGVLVLIVLLSITRIAVLLRRIETKNEELRRAGKKESAIRQLVGAMQEVRVKKQFTSRVSLPDADELTLLGTEFNHMIEELHAREVGMAEAESKLQKQALSDALTGLPNRRLFSDRVSQSIAASKRDGSMLAMLYIDLDGFKMVNDSLGHNCGDALLVHLTERIGSSIRKADTLARLGGDEFAVLMNRVKTPEDAEALAHLLLQQIGSTFEIDGHKINIGASIGICLFPGQAEDESQLLRFADRAMYSAKHSGKNRAVLFTRDLGNSVRDRLTIENQMRQAIEDGDISVHYQPEFKVGSGDLVRFEALARWTHAELGNIPPSQFIPIAEESGLIVSLGAYVLERACTDCLSWQSNAERPIEVAVNVSNVQFGRDSFADEVEAILKKTGLPPVLLQLELTESVILIGVEKAVATIQRLQSLGVTVAVDDFGTGYSALSHIQRLPFDTLKIDRVFLKDIGRRETKAMVRSLIRLAQEMGMKVIVEGVETEAQFNVIRAMGADEVQGFLLGRPTPNPLQHVTSKRNNRPDQLPCEKQVSIQELLTSVSAGRS